MTDRSRRHLISVAGSLSALAAAGVLSACGKQEPAAPKAEAKAEPKKADPLKAAWIYVGPVGDAGWSFAHDLGRKAVEAKFGSAAVSKSP